MTITRTSGRPYPNVRRARQSQGWEATHPTNGKQKYLGTFPTPEGARQAVLISQAQHLEAKAARYRAEADELGAIREQYRAQGEA